MRSFLAHITLHGLLAVSLLSVFPWELMNDQQQEQFSFFEGENEKEQEKEAEKEDSEEKKRNKNEEKDLHILFSVRIVEDILRDHSLPQAILKPEWDAPILAVLSPPPEEMLG